MRLVEEAEEEATELTLTKNTHDCYYWIVKLVIKLAVSFFLYKKTQKFSFSVTENNICKNVWAHTSFDTTFQFCGVILL